ncbi:MAG: hypothetical protein AAFV95_23325 [Bacteroidota bacterium]
MKKYLLLTAVVVSSLMACKKEDVTPDANEIKCTQCIQFDNMEVGQISKYVKFEGENYIEKSNPKITYEADTLIWEITEQQGDVYIIQERQLGQTGAMPIYRVQRQDNKMVFRNADDVLLYELPLDKIETPKAQPKGWEIGLTCQEEPCTGFVENHEQNGKTFEHLNIYKDYTPMHVDGPGSFLLYDPSLGVVRHAWTGSWIPVGGGWDLITD